MVLDEGSDWESRVRLVKNESSHNELSHMGKFRE